MYIPFLPGQSFHIYNRGNNRENIFLEERNYYYFMTLYQQYMSPVLDTFAYCLLPSHFHIGGRVKDEADLVGQKPVHQCFRNMFISYTKAINKAYGRRSSLFEKHLKRKLITNEDYLRRVVVYIHRNPETHGLIDDFKAWNYSSYLSILDGTAPLIQGKPILDWFGGRQGFFDAHESTILDLALA